MSRRETNADTIALAAQALREGRDSYDLLGCYPTSTRGDIALITWHLIYHTGHAPIAARPSRGHSIAVTLDTGDTVIARVTNPRDHRNGVEGFGYVEVTQ